MPDWNVELTYTTGQHQAVTKSVTIKDVDKMELAKLAGIEECLKWGTDEGTIPAPAWEYWQDCRRKPMMLYEVLTELESRWQLTVNIQEDKPSTAAAEVPPARLSPPAKRNGASAPPTKPFDLQGTLLDHMEELKVRQREIASQRKSLDIEWAMNASSIEQIRRFFMSGQANKFRSKKKHGEVHHPVDSDGDTTNAK